MYGSGPGFGKSPLTSLRPAGNSNMFPADSVKSLNLMATVKISQFISNAKTVASGPSGGAGFSAVA